MGKLHTFDMSFLARNWLSGFGGAAQSDAVDQLADDVARVDGLRMKKATTAHHGDAACKTCVFVGGKAQVVPGLLQWLKGEKAVVNHLPLLPTADVLQALPSACLLIVDVDVLNGILDIVDDLIYIRHQRPDVVILLLSSRFASNSFDQTRLAVADVCIRLPATLSSITTGIAEARENNRAWILRNTLFMSQDLVA